jgi:hypothetical protein
MITVCGGSHITMAATMALLGSELLKIEVSKRISAYLELGLCFVSENSSSA